jgi:hypothetical protein
LKNETTNSLTFPTQNRNAPQNKRRTAQYRTHTWQLPLESCVSLPVDLRRMLPKKLKAPEQTAAAESMS